MPDTVRWLVTFGLGTPDGSSYSEVFVPGVLTRAEQEQLVRATAFERYGTAWAFIYPGRDFWAAVGRWHLTLRDTITVPTHTEVWHCPQPEQYRVLDERWTNNDTERHIYRVEEA